MHPDPERHGNNDPYAYSGPAAGRAKNEIAPGKNGLERTAMTVPYVALTPWYSALANRLNVRANVVCLGDSITEGQGAVDNPGTGFNNRWEARLRDLLRVYFPTAGLTGGGRGFIGALDSGEGSFTWPTTVTGSPASGSTLGPKSEFAQLNASGQAITFPLTGDSADIMWTQVPFGGTFSYKIDNNPAVNISTNGGSISDGQITHASLGINGSHNVTVSWVSGNSDIDGVVEYAGDYAGGIQVHDAGHYGWKTSDWTGPISNGAQGPANAIAALKPGLVIITLGANDQFAGIAPATYQSNLQSIISGLRAELTGVSPSIVLSMLPPRGGQSGYAHPWSAYVAAANAVAAADTQGPNGVSLVSVCDFTTGPLIPGPDTTNVYGLWNATDKVHPTDAGHDLIASYLRTFVSPTVAT
jgi:lysophospholipase L1-like esterase